MSRLYMATMIPFCDSRSTRALASHTYEKKNEMHDEPKIHTKATENRKKNAGDDSMQLDLVRHVKA